MLKIKQDSKYKSEDWWTWWAWIDGEKEELDAVQSVTWILHSTFKDPVKVIDDRKSKFKLETAGWGIFNLKAKVKFKDSREDLKLSKEIELYYPDGTKNLD
ncbi:MAG TPA: pYEATS domain-containing protein [Cyclobacteriaceae bacterium]